MFLDFKLSYKVTVMKTKIWDEKSCVTQRNRSVRPEVISHTSAQLVSDKGFVVA